MNDISAQLNEYKAAIEEELTALLNWWKMYAVDDAQGGFHGEVGNDNKAIPEQPKGIVLNSRILWTFSSAFLLKQQPDDLAIATCAFRYISDYFYDSSNGGFYWSLKADGKVLEGKKQIYGQAFAIYGLSEYYKATKDEKALEMAKETFLFIERYSYDPIHWGYTEALDQSWQAMSDLRLSDKDLNTEKSMNTHLHIVEAYANLYSVWKDERLAESIRKLLVVFKKYILTDNYHLNLFFTANWESQSSVISYGHDIEAAWLLQECAEILGDKEEIAVFKALALQLTDAVQNGIDEDGGMYYEEGVCEKHWWPQAEAMVGFFNAYQLTGNNDYVLKSIKSWNFVKFNLKDNEKGEWYWGIYPDGTLMKENKAGFWKCPYHNGRACMEISKRLASYFTSNVKTPVPGTPSLDKPFITPT